MLSNQLTMCNYVRSPQAHLKSSLIDVAQYPLPTLLFTVLTATEITWYYIAALLCRPLQDGNEIHC